MKPARRGLDQALAVVVQHHRHVAPRQSPGSIRSQPPCRQLHGKERMPEREFVFLAQVDQRDLAALPQRVAHGLR